MAGPTPTGSVLVFDNVAASLTSSLFCVLDRSKGENAVIVQMIPQGATPSASLQLIDSADGFGYDSCLDTRGTVAAQTATTKLLVPNVLDVVKAQITITSGAWSVRLTPIAATTPGNASQSSIEQAVRAGNAFVWLPGKLNPATGQARLLISNPSGSGKNLYLYADYLSNDTATMLYATLFRDPTAGLPALGGAGVGIANQNGGSATTSVAQVGADTSATAMSGGTTVGAEAVAGNTSTSRPAALYVIPSGHTLGFNVPVAASTNIQPEFYWFEGV